jgi:hypothetical protein
MIRLLVAVLLVFGMGIALAGGYIKGSIVAVFVPVLLLPLLTRRKRSGCRVP